MLECCLSRTLSFKSSRFSKKSGQHANIQNFHEIFNIGYLNYGTFFAPYNSAYFVLIVFLQQKNLHTSHATRT